MLSFRKCRADDLSALCALSSKTYRDTFFCFCPEETMRAYLDRAFCHEEILSQLSNQNSAFYFAFAGETLVGYIKLNEFSAQTDIKENDALELERIYLLNEFQGRGYGKELLNKAIASACEKNKRYIWLGVWDKNGRAIDFYSKNGFTVCGEHDFIMGQERQHDYIMKKEL